MGPDDETAELFNRIRKARGEAQTRAWLNRIWEMIQAHAAASQAQAAGKLYTTFNPQLEASLLLLLWKKRAMKAIRPRSRSPRRNWRQRPLMLQRACNGACLTCG